MRAYCERLRERHAESGRIPEKGLAMSDSMSGAPARSKLRAAIAEVELHVSGLADAGKLAISWHKLVPLIAPESEPETRACPHCKERIMLLATRCVQCWKKSTAPAAKH
jgi:hypothetical protein